MVRLLGCVGYVRKIVKFQERVGELAGWLKDRGYEESLVNEQIDWVRRLDRATLLANSGNRTMDPIPQLHQSYYSLRKRDVVGRIMARTEKFKSSFYPHCLCEWNDIEPKLAPSVACTICTICTICIITTTDLHHLSLFLRRRSCLLSAPPCKSCLRNS